MDEMKKPSPAPMSKKPAAPKNPWMLASIVLAIALLVSLGMQFYGTAGSSSGTVLSTDEAGSQITGFVNNVFGPQVGQASLQSIEEKSGLYEVTLSLTAAPPGQETQVVFMTRDGKYFIPQALDIAVATQQFQQLQQQGGIPAGTVPAPTDGSAPIDTGDGIGDGQPLPVQ